MEWRTAFINQHFHEENWTYVLIEERIIATQPETQHIQLSPFEMWDAECNSPPSPKPCYDVSNSFEMMISQYFPDKEFKLPYYPERKTMDNLCQQSNVKHTVALSHCTLCVSIGQKNHGKLAYILLSAYSFGSDPLEWAWKYGEPPNKYRNQLTFFICDSDANR